MKNKIISMIIVVTTIILTVLSMYYIKKNAYIETNLDKYMPQEHKAFVYSNKAEEEFNIKDAILFVIKNDNGIYNKGTLQNIKTLSKELKKIKGITKVTSLYTAENIVSDDSSLSVKKFYKRVPKSEEKLKKLQNDVKANEMIFGRIVSKNEKSTLVIAEIKDDVFSDAFYEKMMNIAKKYNDNGDDSVMVAGRPIIEGTMGKLGPKDMKKMVPIVFVVIIVILFFIMRSFRNTFFTILVVGFSTIWTFGLMSFMNIPIYAVSIMIPVMLIAIGVADGIHIYSHMTLYKKEHPECSTLEILTDMLKEIWRPVVMTSVTTAIGFISLLTSEVYPIKYFGMFTAFGVMMAMLLSLILIPAGVTLLGFPKPKKEKELKIGEEKFSFLSHLAEKVILHKYKIVAITVLTILISGYGITKVWIDSSFLKNFEDDSEIVQVDKFVNKNFGGTSTLNVILEGKNKGDFKDPKILKIVNELQKDAEKLKLIGSSFSLTDYMKRMNQVMHADNIEFNTIPDNKDEIAQYLLLYEMSGDPDNLWKTVDYDYKKMNLVFQLKNDSSKTINEAISIIKKYENKFKEVGVNINYAGSGYKALVFTELILEGQIKSLFISLIIIFLLISMIFKNFVIGLIGSAPIILTALINFGIMGILGIPLSSTTALLSSISVGIGIDYAIHFIERYKIYAQNSTDKIETASQTMEHSGRAIIFNAFVVISGFLVLTVSVFPPNRELGALVSLNMFTSFLGTITIMLLLLFKSNIFFKEESNSKIN